MQSATTKVSTPARSLSKTKDQPARLLNAFPLHTHLQLETSLFSSSYLSTISPTTAARMFYILDLCVAPHLNYGFMGLALANGTDCP